MAQQFTQKYTIVQLFEDLPDEYEYGASDWPLHVTLADVFATDWSPTGLLENCEREFSTYQSFEAVAADDTRFGDKGEVLVTLIRPNKELQKLHEDVVHLLEKGNVRFNSRSISGRVSKRMPLFCQVTTDSMRVKRCDFTHSLLLICFRMRIRTAVKS